MTDQSTSQTGGAHLIQPGGADVIQPGGADVIQTGDTNGIQPRPSNRAFAVYVLTFFVVWSLRATVFISIDEGIESAVWKSVYSNSIKFIVWVAPVFIILGVLRLKPFTYLKLTTRANKRGLLVIAIVTLLWLSLVVLGESIIQHKSIVELVTARSSEWLSILAGVILSPIWEEILFRGFFLNRLNASLGFWKSNVISALLFMLAHWPYWVSKLGFSAQVIKDSVNVFLLGCLFGWLMKKTNSLWPSIGAHIANNFLSGLIHA
ncbi:MAG: CPBP family intramembrane glutamic endopeptidase [Acidobacteriota bacterium]